MVSKANRLKKARQSPTNVTFDELAGILEDHDFLFKRVAGSHTFGELRYHIFRHEAVGITLSIPTHGSKVKEIYVKKALAAIDSAAGGYDD